MEPNFVRDGIFSQLHGVSRETQRPRSGTTAANTVALLCTLAREKTIDVQRQIGHQPIIMCRQVQPG